MKILIIYDSVYGNTQKIATVISGALVNHQVILKHIDQVTASEIKYAEIVVLGSPTHGGNAKPETQRFLTGLLNNQVIGKSVITFDTRFDVTKQNWFLRMLMKSIGYAAPKMMKILVDKGAIKLADPEGFFVVDKNGPITEGELDRARKWIRQVIK